MSQQEQDNFGSFKRNWHANEKVILNIEVLSYRLKY